LLDLLADTLATSQIVALKHSDLPRPPWRRSTSQHVPQKIKTLGGLSSGLLIKQIEIELFRDLQRVDRGQLALEQRLRNEGRSTIGRLFMREVSVK